ncbi:mechanosensitive ion channel, MscS family [Deferribacter desulfuricans SSM1]|uniref:Mechanosensitive ion channel, MscS family n=1 Tax=Deferribacter desulfuricans (strain DSM 14783 / JCM 11476 / NBRC 101012 / SSM1) TaxID=639282 RepID=D3PDS0_DEFDS|nr:mechanosensitive ion channel domain-containing protein [Deferribacter desulfuricans]BAI80743.1 mechanosensitive ion channel, MscS family [Deferribacter desulfuricans SSM1]
MDWNVYRGILIGYTIKVVLAILIIIVGRFLSKKISKLAGLGLKKANADEMLVDFLSDLLYYALFIISVVIALNTLGFKTTSLAAIIGAATLAIGLSLQSNLSNFGSGVLILLTKPFKVGDFVEVGGISGSVQKISIFNTELLTPDNKKIIVPNSSIIGNPITNFSANDTRRVDLTIGISYESDIKKAKAILEKIVNSDGRILKEPACTIAVAELADSSINIVVRPWVKASDYWAVKFDLLERIKERFDAEGVVIPYPQMDVHVKKD